MKELLYRQEASKEVLFMQDETGGSPNPKRNLNLSSIFPEFLSLAEQSPPLIDEPRLRDSNPLTL